MAKVIQKQEMNIEKSLYHYGFFKMINTYELQKEDLPWKQFVVANGFETVKEELKEKELLMITNNVRIEK